jgi:hypothetical protein
MLDTVVADINWPHSPFGEEQVFKNDFGKYKSIRQRTPVPGQFKWSSMHAQSRRGGKIIRIEGSPASFLQGHNLFGTNDVAGLLYLACRDAFIHLKIEFSPNRLRAAVAKARLKRVDLAASLALPLGIETADVIKGLRDGLSNAPGHVHFYNMETTLEPGGDTPSRTFYDKKASALKRIAKKWTATRFTGKKYLQRKLEGLLRFEVRLPCKWLERRKLDRPERWSKAHARDLLRSQLHTTFARGAVVRMSEPQICDSMTKAEMKVFYLWLGRRDLRYLCGETSLRVHRQRFMDDFWFDIRSRPPKSLDERIELGEIVNASRLYLGFPVAARKRGLIALPSQLR